MNIHELSTYNLADAVKFHRRLNPRIWGRDEHLLPEVRNKLLAIAADFQEFLGVEDLNVKDITISGSNAAYSYTKNSDIDLHLVVEMPADPVYQELFTAKKYQYNSEHNIRIGGADVELYVQPADQAHHSQGIYSVQHNNWISVPRRKRAQIDDACVRDKVADLDARIHDAVRSGDESKITTLADKIKAMRQAGLEQQGEFGCENLAFKMLRNSGCIKLLWDARRAAQDRELSLRETSKKPFRYGFGEGMQSQPYSTSDGVAASTKQFLENSESNDENLVQEFIQHTAMELGIDPMPEIHLHTNPEWSTNNHSFGRYDPDSHTLNVSMPNRHILDVLRTVAHELVHCSQNQQQGGLPDDAGETGSRWENDANARAGIIMRDWANTHPEHFELPALGKEDLGKSINESNQLTLQDFVVTISPHALSQAYNKGVDVHMVDDMLRNISSVKDNIMSLEPGRALILHNGQGTGLGIRRGQGNRLTLATVFPTSPGFTKGKHPTFRVEANDIDEGWKSALAGAGAAAAMAFTPAPANSTAAPSVQPAAAVQQAPQAGPESVLSRVAQAAGIKGTELAQFLAQCAHETGDFAHLEELGGNRYLAQYDPAVNPAKAKALGNTQAGDGAKYKGRGFIQITGKANYTNAGQALGMDLVNSPELAAKPDVAAKIAVWYWQNRVAPYVQDFADTRSVTKRINPGLQGLQDRVDNFKDYQQQTATVAAPPARVAAVAPTGVAG